MNLLVDTRWATTSLTLLDSAGQVMKSLVRKYNAPQVQLPSRHQATLKEFFDGNDIKSIEKAGVVFAPGNLRCISNSFKFLKYKEITTVPIHYHEACIIDHVHSPATAFISTDRHFEIISIRGYQYYDILGMNVEISLGYGLERLIRVVGASSLSELGKIAEEGELEQALRHLYPIQLPKFRHSLEPVVSPAYDSKLTSDWLFSIFYALSEHIVQQVAKTTKEKVVFGGNLWEIPTLANM